MEHPRTWAGWRRFLFLEALRGFTALSVTVFHLYRGPLRDSLQRRGPKVADLMLMEWRSGREFFLP